MALKPLARIPLTRSSGSSGSSSGGGGSENGPLGLGRTCTLRVSFAGLLAGIIILMIALGWMFAFGVIVGRGYDPEEKLPRLAGLLPRQESGAESGQGDSADAAEPAPGILKAEELTFMRDLRLPPTGETLPAEPPPPSVQAAPAPEPKAKTPDTARYEFVFQVAAFKNSSQSDNLRERLEGEGLRTRMTIEKDNKGKPRWYRVQVILRGTEADAEGVTRILHKARLRDARVVSKTAVDKIR